MRNAQSHRNIVAGKALWLITRISSQIHFRRRLAPIFWMLACLFATFTNYGLGVGHLSAQTASPGDNLIVCGNTNWGGLNQARTQAMRDKLSNTTYFGAGGTYSESTFSFVVIGIPTTANLTANGCNIWFSGYDNNPPYTALATFVANGGFVIAGCDTFGFDAACTGIEPMTI